MNFSTRGRFKTSLNKSVTMVANIILLRRFFLYFDGSLCTILKRIVVDNSKRGYNCNTQDDINVEKLFEKR